MAKPVPKKKEQAKVDQPTPVVKVPPLAPEPQLVHLTAWALVKRRGGLAPLRLEVDVWSDFSDRPEVTSVRLEQEDYRAITEKKVGHLLSSHTPEWPA